jgi:hypothetical protein
LIFDANEKSLIRRTYTVWNASPSRDLDFTWTPASVALDAAGLVTGNGRLIWRPKSKPAYDRNSIYSEYVGGMKDGKYSGVGAYSDRLGYQYEGHWSDGQFEGSGRLQLPNGDEYVGFFRRGKAHGEGRYIQSDGEIYSGKFKDGLRDGYGKVRLPAGHGYDSEWISGKEIDESQKVRVAQGGPPTVGSDDIRLGILVDTLPLKKGMLGYTASNTTEGLIIRPDKRLMDWWKGSGDIQLNDEDQDPNLGGIFPFLNAALPPVLLVLDLENRRSFSTEVVDAYLDVRTSSIDVQPMVLVRGDGRGATCGQSYDPTFSILNYGWTSLEQAHIRLTFADPRQSVVLGPQSWSKELGASTAATTVDVDENLRAAGVNVRILRERGNSSPYYFTCDTRSQSDCFAELMRTGLFGQIAPYISLDDFHIQANLAGLLRYKWKDTEGRINEKESPFRARVLLGELVHAAECEGGEMEPLRTSAPVNLEFERTGYKLPIGLRSTIPAGRVSRYSVPIRASKSSRHEFRVVLVLADGREVRSRSIDLLYFFPNRWDRTP